jgi:hypothetical protein
VYIASHELVRCPNRPNVSSHSLVATSTSLTVYIYQAGPITSLKHTSSLTHPICKRIG